MAWDADNKRPGFKFADYELRGVPVRLVMGGRDLENNTVEIMRRDTLEKETRQLEGIVEHVEQLLDDIQANIFAKAKAYRDERIYECDNYEEFKEKVKDGGFFADGVELFAALGDGHDHHLYRCELRWEHQAVVVGMGHDERSDEAGGHAP